MEPAAATPSVDTARDALARRHGARAVAFEVLERRERGEALSDDAVIGLHPRLMPELGEELVVVAGVRAARLAAKDPGSLSPVEVLDDDQLVQPLELGEFDSGFDDSITPPKVPVISGYGIVDEVGRGGQGTVYQAIQESTGRTVAIKVMVEGLGATSRHRARFGREAKILAAIQHPNVVAIIDRGRTQDGCLYFVMDYILGSELADYWRRIPAGVEGTRELLALFSKICRAVQEAHTLGVVHRDLKPTNVRVDERGEPHVLDFGLAREPHGQASALTRSGQIVGSVPWASPEQAAGDADNLSAASDVYSIGVMLYQSLTGQHPYLTFGPIRRVLDNIATAIPQQPSRVPGARRLGRSLDAVVLRALSKQPTARYPTAGALADDLDNILRGRPVHYSPSRWTRRSAIVLWTGGVAALVASAWIIPTLTQKHVRQVIELPQFTNIVGMRLVRVPSGSFMMGSSMAEQGGGPAERQHLETIDQPFFVATTEVTQKQFWSVMESNPSDSRFLAPDLPVNRVTWFEATEFCARLSRREGRRYRLPTEAEWEYACRAGSAGSYNTPGALDSIAWYSGNSRGMLHQGGRKLPNLWGLYDMHGNVAEWCSDIFRPGSGDTTSYDRHSFKGGSAFSAASDCRSAAHSGIKPESRRFDIGFRVVCDTNS